MDESVGLSWMANNRKAFFCPAAPANSAWDTNVNKTLGGAGEDGRPDPFAISLHARSSFGYNDWGLAISHIPQLGLGGDVDAAVNRGPVRDTDVRKPVDMIMLADVRAQTDPNLINMDADIDPTDNARTTGGMGMLYPFGRLIQLPPGSLIIVNFCLMGLRTHRSDPNRRLEFELCASFSGARGLALVVPLRDVVQNGLGAFRCANLHPRSKPLHRQGPFAPQPANDRQLAAVVAPERG